jgi:signal transduction histidine kinase
LLELYDALAQRQLREAGAEVAAAIAHAVGTPLNVISGRAELIRHDPSNALAQVARIEEQVKKLASGLRQVVDYLAVPDPQPALPAAGRHRRPADAAEASGPSRPATSKPAAPAAPSEVVAVRAILEDVAALADSFAGARGVELVVSKDGVDGARVERWHALGTLSALVSAALRHCSEAHAAAEAGAGGSGRSAPRVLVSAGVASQGVVFELVVPGLPLVEGWQLEHFQNRPAETECSEIYRTLSICGAVVRGHGGRLLLEAAPTGQATVRFSCRNEAS